MDLILPAALSDEIAREARAAFPHECCGLIEGARTGDSIRAVALYPACNLAELPDRFEIDPAEHIRLLRRLRGTAGEIVGCYHSHPNGRPEPSPHDLRNASESGLVWLIAASSAACVKIRAFMFTGREFAPLSIREAPEALTQAAVP